MIGDGHHVPHDVLRAPSMTSRERPRDRALDGFTRLRGRSVGVEAETRITDVQAIARKVQLKKRDTRLDMLILLVSDTRANRGARAVRLQGRCGS